LTTFKNMKITQITGILCAVYFATIQVYIKLNTSGKGNRGQIL